MLMQQVTGDITDAQMSSGDIIVFTISKDEVQSKDFSRVDNLIMKWNKFKKKAAHRFMIAFGYDDDSRDIWEIEEICEYAREIFKRCPHFLYFLIPDLANAIAPILYSIIGVETISASSAGKQVKPMSMELSDEITAEMKSAIKIFTYKIHDVEGGQTTISEARL